MLTDFPKLHSPFIRRHFQANKKQLHDFLTVRKMRRNREGLLRLVTREIDPHYKWVFEDPETIAVEKVDGSNVKVKVEHMRVAVVQNRLNPPIDLLKIGEDNSRYAEAILNMINKKLITEDGEYAGELLGPLVQGNPYKLSSHEWYPFHKSVDSLQYKSFSKFERTFDNWESWFKDHLRSLLYAKRHGVKFEDSIFAEGIIFYNMKRKLEGKVYMAKLRRDMFRFYYEGVEISTTPEQETI